MSTTPSITWQASARARRSITGRTTAAADSQRPRATFAPIASPCVISTHRTRFGTTGLMNSVTKRHTRHLAPRTT